MDYQSKNEPSVPLLHSPPPISEAPSYIQQGGDLQQQMPAPTYTVLPKGQVQMTAPTFTTLPNGQVQMHLTVTLPPGQYAPQPYQHPSQPYPHDYQQYAPPPFWDASAYPAPLQGGEGEGRQTLATVVLATYIVGMFTFLPHIVSIITSLYMVRRGFIARTGVVITCSILELLGWVFCASFSWFFVEDYCYPGGRCAYTWWGWIAIVVWFAVAISSGVPRVIFCYKPRPTYM